MVVFRPNVYLGINRNDQSFQGKGKFKVGYDYHKMFTDVRDALQQETSTLDDIHKAFTSEINKTKDKNRKQALTVVQNKIREMYG